MQASKIELGHDYAVKRGDKLVRFRPSSVTTTRYRKTGSPHDYKSTVNGRFYQTDIDLPGEHELEPESLLGPFEQYAELVERKRKEEEVRQRVREEEREAYRELRRMFYRVTKTTMPNDHEEYKQLFRTHGYSIDIDKEGAKLLIAALKEYMKEEAQ